MNWRKTLPGKGHSSPVLWGKRIFLPAGDEKTGARIAGSGEARASLGGANPEARHALAGSARDLGLAFQIADDLLDVLGSAADLGKATGKDEAAGKVTFVSLLGVEKAQERARLLSDQAIGHLEIFGAKAEHLRAMAKFVIERRT